MRKGNTDTLCLCGSLPALLWSMTKTSFLTKASLERKYFPLPLRFHNWVYDKLTTVRLSCENIQISRRKCSCPKEWWDLVVKNRAQRWCRKGREKIAFLGKRPVGALMVQVWWMCLLSVVPTSVSISWDRSASSLLMKLPGMGLRTTAFPVGHLSSGREKFRETSIWPLTLPSCFSSK